VLLAICTATGFCAHATDDDPPQLLYFQVVAPDHRLFDNVIAEMDRLGEAVEVVLRDNGSDATDLLYDGVYVGEHEGEYARYVSVRLIATLQDGSRKLLYSGVEATSDRRMVPLGWVVKVQDDGTLSAHRTVAAYSGCRTWHSQVLRLAAVFGWAGLLIVYVSRLVWLSRRENPG